MNPTRKKALRTVEATFDQSLTPFSMSSFSVCAFRLKNPTVAVPLLFFSKEAGCFEEEKEVILVHEAQKERIKTKPLSPLWSSLFRGTGQKQNGKKALSRALSLSLRYLAFFPVSPQQQKKQDKNVV